MEINVKISSLPSFELISKHISLSDANASGWGAWATHRFDFQSQSHSIEVWEDLWKPQLHGDYVIFHELTHLLDTENLVNGDKKKNAMVRGFLEYHAKELISCLEVGAYKACMILCGSILETILLDWLSELENTNYFVDDDNMHINLYGVIRRLKEIYNPSWNSEANAAHDIRLKRNLVHPVKFVVENPTVNRDTCLQVLREMQSILISRGFENGFTIPAN